MSNERSKTTFLTREQGQSKRWFLFDATGKTLGRFATEIAKILRGKHRVDFTPNVDCGDGVIIVNADKILVTGAKEAQKIYRNYTGFIGGMIETPYRDMMKKNPTYIIEHAVKGMMPKTKLGKAQLKRLRIFKDANHEMDAQKPISVNI